jgi:Holliday junction DNA helicase RuvA
MYAMINRIFGKVIEKNERYVVVLLASSLALEVFVSNNKQYSIGSECVIYIAMHFNAERGYTLYGFADELEKDYFGLLCECQGIGAKLALTILGGVSLVDLYNAVAHKNQLVLEAISGIGKKKAELIISELYRKLEKLPHVEKNIDQSMWSDVDNALEALGYKEFQIRKIISILSTSTFDDQVTLPELIQHAVQIKL